MTFYCIEIPEPILAIVNITDVIINKGFLPTLLAIQKTPSTFPTKETKAHIIGT
jgi:hypothetical protein